MPSAQGEIAGDEVDASIPEAASATAIGVPASSISAVTRSGTVPAMAGSHRVGVSCANSIARPWRTRGRSMSSITVIARNPKGTIR